MIVQLSLCIYVPEHDNWVLWNNTIYSGILFSMYTKLDILISFWYCTGLLKNLITCELEDYFFEKNSHTMSSFLRPTNGKQCVSVRKTGHVSLCHWLVHDKIFIHSTSTQTLYIAYESVSTLTFTDSGVYFYIRICVYRILTF